MKNQEKKPSTPKGSEIDSDTKFLRDVEESIEEANKVIKRFASDVGFETRMKSEELTGNAKKTIAKVRERRDDLKKKIAEVRHGSKAAAKELRSGIEKAWSDLNTSMKSARAHLA